MGIFTALALFLKPLHLFVKLSYILSEIYSLVFLIVIDD